MKPVTIIGPVGLTADERHALGGATLVAAALPEPVAELVRFVLTTLANGDSVAVIRTTP